MQLEFVGAAQTVTGSKHILRVNGKTYLLDCGMFQGRRKESDEANRFFPIKVEELDALILSHAHIDHAGLIPLLVKRGFKGPIYCTHATRDLCSIMLQDSARIQTHDAEHVSRKTGKTVEPLYTEEDAKNALMQFRSVGYEQKIPLTTGVFVTFHDAGHILGSALEEWEIDDKDTGEHIRFCFTGDLGRKHLPILREPTQLKDIDILITESTYGNRFHDELAEVEEHLTKVINDAVDRGGKIFIPAFAVERTQEILYVLRLLMHQGKIVKLPIYVDSPLATSATDIFKIHPECFDEEILNATEEGLFPFLEGEGVRFTRSVEESKGLDRINYPAIIIAASGMVEFGRIVHHVANNIEDERNLLLVIGYMAENTLGRKLVEGATQVNIFDEPKEVKMQIATFNAFSGHADRKGLLEFAEHCGNPKQIFLVHGEKEGMDALSSGMKELPNLANTTITAPAPGDIYDVVAGKLCKKSPTRNMECNGIVCKI
ncbi:MBL fold metallo-hydrolase [Candidatus Gracilibacteria bacterium]|nr:MBL fold metallo-hydrolase [Candidatus Gracilibacteria bacterium]